MVDLRFWRKPPQGIQPMELPKSTPPKSALVALIGTAAAGALITTVSMWEGKSNDPYKDIVGVATVCYGETKVSMRRYSDEECRAMLEESLVGYARPVLERNPELAGHPNQLAATVSLAYNIGPANYRKSTVAKRFSAGQWRSACDNFLAWQYAGGKPVKGLLNRRRHERELCLKGL